MTRAKNNSRSSRLKTLILLVNIFFVILLILTYITPHVSVEKWGWLTLLALAYPFTLFANFLFALGWIFFRSWMSALSIIALLAGYPQHEKYIQLLPSGKSAHSCEESIRVLTYNVRGLSMVPVDNKNDTKGKIDFVYNALADEQEFPDIICLQEASKGDQIAKRFGLSHSVHGPKSSLWILSRYPIIDKGSIDGAETSPSAMWADISTPQGKLRVYNMHLVSNRVTNTTEELIQDMDFKKQTTWNNIKFIFRRYRTTTEKRAGEAVALRAHADKCKYPVLIAGDGNDPPMSHTYKLLKKGYFDSFQEKGFGLSTTYDSTLPLLRIDYLLGSDRIFFKDHTTHHIGYSDHYPVSTGICIQDVNGS
ncbi:MAG: endonuclease/exonuclease/phosphatase family protein [Bacteroidota bacterium]|nr:endonuclease/exonuclease/phosphatase family protein [Bacteroidota bacterium]